LSNEGPKMLRDPSGSTMARLVADGGDEHVTASCHQCSRPTAEVVVSPFNPPSQNREIATLGGGYKRRNPRIREMSFDQAAKIPPFQPELSRCLRSLCESFTRIG
jgi:hypothetical protein